MINPIVKPMRTYAPWTVEPRIQEGDGYNIPRSICDAQGRSVLTVSGRIGGPKDWQFFAELGAAAPDLYDQMLALFKYGWQCKKWTLDGVTGWCWQTPAPKPWVFFAEGPWDGIPSWPEEARQLIATLENRGV
jgi:hypothetical protein